MVIRRNEKKEKLKKKDSELEEELDEEEVPTLDLEIVVDKKKKTEEETSKKLEEEVEEEVVPKKKNKRETLQRDYTLSTREDYEVGSDRDYRAFVPDISSADRNRDSSGKKEWTAQNPVPEYSQRDSPEQRRNFQKIESPSSKSVLEYK